MEEQQDKKSFKSVFENRLDRIGNRAKADAVKELLDGTLCLPRELLEGFKNIDPDLTPFEAAFVSRHIEKCQSCYDIVSQKGVNERKIYVLVSNANLLAKEEKYKGVNERKIYVLVSNANLLAKEEKYEEAEKRLKEALEIDAYSARALHAWWQLEKKRHNYAGAWERFEEVLRNDPHNIPALHALGQMALERGYWKEARSRLEEALSLDPDNLQVLHAMGMLWSEMGDDEAALQRFAEVLSRDPENLETLVARAVLEGKRKNFQEAQRGFKRTRKLIRKLEEETRYGEDMARGRWRLGWKSFRELEEENLYLKVARKSSSLPEMLDREGFSRSRTLNSLKLLNRAKKPLFYKGFHLVCHRYAHAEKPSI